MIAKFEQKVAQYISQELIDGMLPFAWISLEFIMFNDKFTAGID